MENVTDYDYDYNISGTFVTPCDRVNINTFSKAFLPPFYFFIFTVSLLGNGLVLFIIYKFEKLGTVTNIFLINLVASNLIFSIGLPFNAVYQKSEWIFGTVICKMIDSISCLGFYSSVLFLTAMTFDRYLAVVHVVVANKQRHTCYAFTIAAVVWSISFLGSLEPYFNSVVKNDPVVGKICDSNNGKLSIYPEFVLFFLFPLVVVLYCYIRIGLRVLVTQVKGRHRTVKLIFLIVALFFLCWTPYNVILLMKEQTKNNPCDHSLVYPEYITHNIAYLYFCINPVFFTFLGKKFQNHVRRLLFNKIPCIKDVSISSRSSS
ncbi:C-C chemokine receptor type 4-like [Hoplias malabaricus]|uniref:C-C chemokine receptor type 4-like n=1 Tax=Hoplias malabaricus TaxID=27720 RepID=UPI0034631706